MGYHRKESPVPSAKYTLAILILTMMMVALFLPIIARGSTSTASSSSLTWETTGNFGYVQPGNPSSFGSALDPQVAYFTLADSILPNLYEPLLWYNGTSPSQIVPWLAQNYTVSAGGSLANFTLRRNITFADGNPLNSSAVYFSLNRLLILDGGPSWTIQQLENQSLSSFLSGSQNYTQAWAERVLDQDFVETTGPLTFDLHIQHPTASLPYLLAAPWAAIVDPIYVMNHDIALWSAYNSSYVIPYPTPSGSFLNKMNEYFDDEVSTCNTGATPAGCALTYLDTSSHGSLAGTGPYTLSDVSVNRSVTLQARPDYWGGAYQYLGGSKVTPRIQTIYIKNVPVQSDRTRDLTVAGTDGQAMIVDLNTSLDTARLFDVANESDWINHLQLVSVLPGVSISGPETSYATNFDTFDTNVTAPSVGGATVYEKFQPFADLRFRLAFADSVDIKSVDKEFDNNLGSVAINAIPPNLPPAGAFNSSDLPVYRFDPDAVQRLLLSAMLNPISSFHFFNGSEAPPGVFDNTFGCAKLNAQNRCDNPVTRSILLVAPNADTPDASIMNQITRVVNNVSVTYNMGLQVNVQSVPLGTLFQNIRQYYMYSLAWLQDYPWVVDFDSGILSPGGFLLPSDGWNTSTISKTWTQLVQADSSGDIAGVVSANNRLNAIANQMVLYLWTYYPYTFFVHTSNIQGFSYNPSLYYVPFMTLRIGSGAQSTGSANPVLTNPLFVSLAAVVAIVVLGVGLYAVRRNKPKAAAPGPEMAPTLGVAHPSEEPKEQPPAELAAVEPQLELERPESRQTFDYLVSSFIDDYMRKRLYSEQSGWRSLVQISEACKLPQGALYGRGGRYGPAVEELMRRGLIESRTFTGQRGRGGEVVKVRVAYDKEPVKQFVDKSAMKR